MRKTSTLALVLLAAVACQKPPGECSQHLDCYVGQECAGGVCVPLATDHQVGSRCIRNADCVDWADCTAERCVLTAGMCGSGADCATWQTCASHVCATALGFCAGEADCTAWQDCGTDHLCALTPGMCGTGTDCAGWQRCSSNFCTTAPGYCAIKADCAAWQDCGTDHLCALTPGMCATGADCAAWQYCDAAQACTDVGGTCTVDGDCTAWQHCDTGHCANDAGKCGASAQCDPAWRVCDELHTCVPGPGHCVKTGDCAGWQNCDPSNTCVAAVACTGNGDCYGGDVCSGGYCTAVLSSPADLVWLFGSLPVACGSALAPVYSPTRMSIGFPCGTQKFGARMDSSGTLYYLWRDGTSYSIRRFVSDPWEWDSDLGKWTYPSDPLANDAIVPTPACPSEAGDFVVQAGTAAIVYRCLGDGINYWDGDGNVVLSGYDIGSWNENGLMLLDGGQLYLRAADGTVTAITGLPVLVPGGPAALTARVHGPGFWVVVSTPTDAYDLWYVDELGQGTHEGTYSPASEVANVQYLSFTTLDATGALFGVGMVQVDPEVDVVVRCRIAPGGCSIVYDEEDAVFDVSVSPPRAFVLLGLDPIITGP